MSALSAISILIDITCIAEDKLDDNYLACLPWYDDDSTSESLDQFWTVMSTYLRENGVDNLPRDLVRGRDLKSLWRSSQLLLSQCCGPDLFTVDGSALCVVARPAFANLDCSLGCYYSRIVSRTEDLGASVRVAVNSLSSRSGHSALIEWMQTRGIEVASVQISGSHKSSLVMLEKNLADLAAIDAHTLNQLDVSVKLPIIGRSEEALTPPFVFHRSLDLSRVLLFDALKHAVVKRGQAAGIVDLIRCQRSDYERYGIDSNCIIQ